MSQELSALLRAHAPLDDIAAHLDDLAPPARMAQALALSRAEQSRLYELAAVAEPLGPGDFVPSDAPPLREVRHHGLNTLPVPRWGKRFRKVMARGHDGTVFGYNDSPLRRVVGPGFFVMRATRGAEQVHGGAVVDYYRVPSGPVPEGWPRVRPNWLGLQVAVYHHTRDFMRRVSSHVSIGAAYKWGRVPLNSWFVLCRDDGGR